MGVGSDDTVKVWLNGEVVHKYTGGVIRTVINGQANTRRTGRSTAGIQDEFRVNLKAGNNLLLVKVCDYQEDWGMFLGIYLDDADFTTAIPGEAPAPTEQQPTPQPDLVLEAARVVPATVAPGEMVKLYATLKNQGTAESTATEVRC